MFLILDSNRCLSGRAVPVNGHKSETQVLRKAVGFPQDTEIGALTEGPRI